MKATEIPLDIELLDSSLRPSGLGRSPGVHGSEILRWMHSKLEGDYASYDEEGNVRMMMGFLLEMLFERVFVPYMLAAGKLAGRKTAAQQELRKDDIIVTPDVQEGFEDLIEEDKVTWRSMRPLVDLGIAKGLEEEFWYWLLQIKSSCHIRGTNKARLVPLFVNGDYRRGSPLGGPQLRCINLEFEGTELRDAWRTMLVNRDAMLKERDEMARAKKKGKRGRR